MNTYLAELNYGYHVNFITGKCVLVQGKTAHEAAEKLLGKFEALLDKFNARIGKVTRLADLPSISCFKIKSSPVYYHTSKFDRYFIIAVINEKEYIVAKISHDIKENDDNNYGIRNAMYKGTLRAKYDEEDDVILGI